MDGESSCESDISESWSLIDINDESLSIAESCFEVDKNSEFDLKKEKSNAAELEDFVRRCKEINKTDFSGISDSDSDASFKNQGLPTCNATEIDGIDSPLERSSDNDWKHDSADAESIEILDMDDSETGRLAASGFHQFDFPTYQSDDEESLEGNIDNENRSINSAVIKRRRRVSRSSEEIVHSVNSENISSGVNNSTPSSTDPEKVSQKLGEVSKKANSHPVYSYGYNVANTVLSLSVGVIFAGMACIAIGHFLGVQNASDTAVELVETLKKLQVENAALQSRLFHLNRAFLTRETNSKLEIPLNEPHNTVSWEQTPSVDPTESQEKNLNNAALSEIRSSLNSIECLSKLEDYVRRNNKVTDTETGIDFNGFRKFIHDQLCTLNGNQDSGAKILKETDKISKVLQKVINRLSSSQDHIEKLYERLINFKNKLNHKVKRILPESSKESWKERSKVRTKIPVTEHDLQNMNWDPKSDIQKGSDTLDLESAFLYKFPQPENYYQNEKDLGDTTEKKVKDTISWKDTKNKDFEKPEKVESRNKKKYKRVTEKRGEGNCSKDNWKKKRFNEKKMTEKKGGKRRKRNANKVYKFVKNFENDSKNKDEFKKIDESRHRKITDDQNVFNETIYQSKKYLKTGDKGALFKQKFKKLKNSKLRKVLLSKAKKRSSFQKKHYNPGCPGPECFNLTGDWVYKWANGREEIRRHESLRDWQFERAKMRKELREVENEKKNPENWQFERAKVRKELREDEYERRNPENWLLKRAEAREKNRNICSHHGKYSKYIKKDFFHEGLSWF